VPREAGPDAALAPPRVVRTSGVVASDLQIALPGGGTLRGAGAIPETPGPYPGVVVIHEVFGDQPEMRRVCDEFARRGCVAVMPDLFSAGGPRFLCVARTMMDLARRRPGRVLGYVAAAHEWLVARDDVDRERVGVIGFCMGGSFALAYIGEPSAAVNAAAVKVAAVNYGEVPKRADALRSACPIVASYGGRDMVTRSHARRLREHLEQLGIEHDVKVYDRAGHSFMTPASHPIGRLVFLPMRIGYEPRAAADAWERVFSFFGARL
jgi:carboxymethylenebutenolidase